MPYFPQLPVPVGRPIIAATTYLTLPGVSISTTATTAQAANQVKYYPIYVTTPITIDQLSLEVTSAGAGGTTARMGIYHADINWVPGALIADSGTVAVDSTGVKSAAVAVTLAPGRYLLCFNSDGAPTLRCARGNLGNTVLLPTLGANPALFSMRGTQTYGAFPATGTAIDTVAGNTVGFDYVVFPRVSTP